MNKKTKEIFMYILAGLIITGFFTTLFYLIYTGRYESTINLVIGTLLTAFGTIVGFFFGSSKSSQQKDEFLEKKLNKK